MRLILLLCALSTPLCAWQSDLLKMAPDGKLEYFTDEEGNRLPDFSYAGYQLGEKAIPNVPVVYRMEPGPGDDTARIQALLHKLKYRKADKDGWRGAIEFAPGLYRIGGTLRMEADGIVLRGSGSGRNPRNNTVFMRPVGNRSPVVVIGDGVDHQWEAPPSAVESPILDEVLEIGERVVQVKDASLFKEGERVVLHHPSTSEWLASIEFGGTAGDEPWKPGSKDIRYIRQIRKIEGNTITLDAPVFVRMEKELSPYSLQKAAGIPEPVKECGLENLRIVTQTLGPYDERHALDLVAFINAQDCWALQVSTQYFVRAGFILRTASRITLRDCEALDPHALITGRRRYNFCSMRSQLVLVQKGVTSGGRHAYVANGTTLDSGLVFTDCVAIDDKAIIEPHRQWSQGILYDRLILKEATPDEVRLGFYNRGDKGTGHGWSCVNAVAWNADLGPSHMWIQKPPRGNNFAIGVKAARITNEAHWDYPPGHVEGHNRPGLEPSSLYQAQLKDRLGNQQKEAPEIRFQPVGGVFPRGDRASLRVGVEPHQTALYQWYKDGEMIAGAENRILTLEILEPEDEGVYFVEVSYGNGNVRSREVHLEVTSAPPFE